MDDAGRHEWQPQNKGFTPWRLNVKDFETCTRVDFKNILFATDFSTAAESALPYAVAIARRANAILHVVHVIQPDVYPLVPPSEWHRMAQEEAQSREDQKRKLEGELQGLPHEVLFLEGNVWQNLSNVIEEQDIDLLILSTHGRTGIKKALMGSVAEEVFRQAECPVLVVGPGVFSSKRQTATAELSSIVYPTDFSPESFAAAPYAISLANVHQAQLTLMHSIQDTEAGQVNSAFQTLRDVIPFGTVLGSKPKYLVERGSPVDCILQVAAKENADMIVLGVQRAEGHLMAATHLSRSIAHQVIAQATCAVLTVRG